MERLTERFHEDGLCYGKVDCEDNCTYCDRFLKVLNKLADYEDAEEQGLLLRRPCKVGDNLYEPRYSYVNEYKVIGIIYDIVTDKWKYELAYQNGVEWHTVICGFDFVGKSVFLTKEEAESRLAEMKGE